MAYDGSAVHAITKELSSKLTDGRIVKITQPEKDTLILTIKNTGMQYRLLISANPSLPVMYLTDINQPAPLQAPAFCMLLRKHLTNGRILSVSQPSMERIIELEIEHFDEMGDLCRKILTVEMMGKYSNIILRREQVILDSIKHVSALMSSVREVLPGREYFVPFSEGKLNPRILKEEEFCQMVASQGALSLAKSLYTGITGFSPMLSEEILFRAGLDSDRPSSSVSVDEQMMIYRAFREVMAEITSAPNIIYQNDEPVAFGTFHYQSYEDPRFKVRDYDSMSALLSDFYLQKQTYTSLRQKTADLRQTVHTLLNKDQKKYDLQLRQLKDTQKREKFKVYGELLTAYGYQAEPGISSFAATNFYTGEDITIPLDPTLSAVENGKNYFKRYAKLKRTADALEEIIVQTQAEIEHLESILVSLDLAQNPSDIADIKRELSEAGYTRHINKNQGKGSDRKKPAKTGSSSPLQYKSSDGFPIYVGKNNFQNEYLTFKLASGSDWWFHAKDTAGSHVIVKCDGVQPPDRTFEEAASLAAHYSKSTGSDKVEVQYTQRKNLKKPPASRPGFVVFHTYYSMAASTDIRGIEEQ